MGMETALEAWGGSGRIGVKHQMGCGGAGRGGGGGMQLGRWGQLFRDFDSSSPPSQNKGSILRTHVPEGRVRVVPEGGLATFTNVLNRHEKIRMG